MTYKQNKQEQLQKKVEERLTGIPYFIKNYFLQVKSARTRYCYCGHILNMFCWMIERKYIKATSIDKITEEEFLRIKSNQISEYLMWLKNEQKNSSASIETKRNILASFWNYLVVNDYVSKNIIYGFDKDLFRVKDKNKVVKIPTEKQLTKFIEKINEIPDDFLRARNMMIVSLFLKTGMRSEELLGIRKDDLFLNIEPRIRVWGKGSYDEKEFRYIPIDEETAKELEKYLEIVRSLDSDFGIDALFPRGCQKEKSTLSKSGLDKMFKTYSQGEITPHMLRHYVGTKMSQAGVAITVIKDQFGHSSVKTTERFYIGSDMSKNREAIAAMQDMEKEIFSTLKL